MHQIIPTLLLSALTATMGGLLIGYFTRTPFSPWIALCIFVVLCGISFLFHLLKHRPHSRGHHGSPASKPSL